MLKKLNRNNWLIEEGQLTKKGRQLLLGGSFFYFVLLCLMCFLPQRPEPGMETPGIQHFGRVVVLLIPFNSLINLGQVTSSCFSNHARFAHAFGQEDLPQDVI